MNWIATMWVAYLLTILAAVGVALGYSVLIGVVLASIGLCFGAVVVTSWQLARDNPL